jgi:hypothetical protein
MKQSLYLVPLLALPFLLALYKEEKPTKSESPMPAATAPGPRATSDKPMPTVTNPPPRAKSDKPRPPIDVNAPAKVETATFALG